MAEIILTDSSFEKEVIKSKLPVLVDFWAEWCGPCRTLSPLVEQIGEEYAGKIIVAKANVDECPQSASQFNIQSIPTLIVFNEGKPLSQNIGAIPKEKIVSMFQSLLDA